MTAALTLADEIPLAPCPPDWSENYCWHGHDAQRGIGFWIHMGTWPLDTRIWRETIIVFLPDGSAMVQRGYGAGDCAQGPAGALLTMRCATAAQHWSIHYHGPGRRTSTAALLQGGMQENISELLNMELTLTAYSDIWEFGHRDNTAWGRRHYEQMLDFRGRIGFGAETLEVAGTAYRDHSRGPRNLGDWRRHNWIQGRLNDGWGFAIFELWTDAPEGEKKQLDNAVMIDPAGRILPASILASPGLVTPASLQADYELVLQSPARRLELRGRARNTIPISFEATTEAYLFGMAADALPFTAFEQPARFFGNGYDGFGHTERSMRAGSGP